jgi:hypothetical protein
VQGGPGGLDPETAPEPVDEEEGGDLTDAGLDRHQPDELPVEAVEHGVDLERAPLGVDVHQGVVGQRFRGLVPAVVLTAVAPPVAGGPFGPGVRVAPSGHGDGETGAAALGRAFAHRRQRPFVVYRSPAGRSVA